MRKWLKSPVEAHLKYFGRVKNPVVYEVGSRDGHDAVAMAGGIYSNGQTRLWQDATIILFDCNPPQIEFIRKTYPKATLITDAISDIEGQKVEFVQIEGNQNEVGSSSMDKGRLDHSKFPWGTKKNIIEVSTRRLDSIIEELGHEDTEVDIMKIDIEGYTYEALESLGKYLRNVKVFHLETEIEGIARNKTNLDIILFMEENGYRMTAKEHEWGDNIQDQVWVRL